MIDLASLYAPVIMFLFVFLISFAALTKSNLLGGNLFMGLLVSFILAIIFMSFSSMELYLKTVVPWAITLLVVVFLILLIVGFSLKDLGSFMTPRFAGVILGVLVLIFLISAIYVFNPILHSDLGITSSGNGDTILSQFKGLIGTRLGGTILLLALSALIAWAVTKK